ncbi:hypothetical protein ACLB1G_02870 [Oxalobacteraceae bacterium A2-2]
MRLRCLRPAAFLLAFLLTLLHLEAAMACSCIYRDPSGFVHRNLTHLPSNARGVLFMPPPAAHAIASYATAAIYDGDPQAVQADWFSIQGPDGAPVPGELSWPDLSRGDRIHGDHPQGDGGPGGGAKAYRFRRQSDLTAFLAQPAEQRPALQALLDSGQLLDISEPLRAAQRLVRVGPVGGFQPGARYTIAYPRPLNGRDVAPLAVTIDSAPLDTGALRYQLAAEGEPLRRLLPVSANASCVTSIPAMAQTARYLLPDALAPYRQGVSYFSESRPADAADAADAEDYTDLGYKTSLCDTRPFGATNLGDGREQLYASCARPTAAVLLRGWAGLLEVEDRLQPTPAIRIELGGGACTAPSVLQEALDSGERLRIRATACHMDIWLARVPSATEAARRAAADGLMRYALDGEADDQLCAQAALGYLAAHSPTVAAIDAQLAQLSRTGLLSDQRDTVGRTLELMTQQSRIWRATPARVQGLLLPSLPPLVQLAGGSDPAWRRSAAGLLSRLGPAASAHTTALLAAAESSPEQARDLIPALAKIAPGDSRVQAFLLRSASQKELLETAAIAYAGVAGPVHAQDALRLLQQAVQQGSASAIDALAAMGPAASGATPQLIEQMRRPPGDYVRTRAYSALVAVTDGGHDAMDAIAAAINDSSSADYPLRELTKLGARARPLLPAIEQRMQRPMSRYQRDELRAVILAMALPLARQRELLARLAQCEII